MKEKYKIAIYSGEIPTTTFIERLISGLASKGCDIYLFGILKRYNKYSSQNIHIKGYKQNRLSKALFLMYYSTLLFVFRNKEKRKLDDLLRSQSRLTPYNRVKFYPVLWCRPDIFHIQWAKGLEEWFWVREFGIKIALSLRGAHINYSPIADETLANMYTRLFPKVDAFHAVSEAIALEAEKYQADKDKIKVVYSGMDLKQFSTSAIKGSNDTSDYRIISIGRPHWVKGYTYALDAMKILKDKGFNFQYTIIGGIDLELEYQISEYSLMDKIKVYDQLEFSEVQRRIRSSDLLLLPSVEEGIANVVLEAMAQQKIVLATNCGGMREVIQNGKNGFLVPIRQPEIMAKQILEISKLSFEEQERLGVNALETVMDQHQESKMVNDMLDLYQNI